MANILGVVPLAQSLALAGENIKFVKKKDKDVGDFIGQGIGNIVGASLIDETAKFTGPF